MAVWAAVVRWAGAATDRWLDMKDRLGQSTWVNRPARNRTQTTYTRFIVEPQSALASAFSKKADAWKARMGDALRTKYSEYLEDANG